MIINKHTPGPWNLDTVKTDAGICHRIGANAWPKKIRGCQEYEQYACVYDDGSDLVHPTAEYLANARLIAAAPDLLAALQLAATRLEILTGRMRACHEETGNHELLVEAEMFCQEARAAIRRAAGEET